MVVSILLARRQRSRALTDPCQSNAVVPWSMVVQQLSFYWCVESAPLRITVSSLGVGWEQQAAALCISPVQLIIVACPLRVRRSACDHDKQTAGWGEMLQLLQHSWRSWPGGYVLLLIHRSSTLHTTRGGEANKLVRTRVAG